MILLSASQMQEVERYTIEQCGLPGRILMENAGRGATRVLLKSIPEINGYKVAVIAGKGNNGGDGFVIARYLHNFGVSVTVYLIGESSGLIGDAEENFKLLNTLNIPVVEIPDQSALLTHKTAMGNKSLWIDAIFGTGLNSDIKGLFRSAIEFINSLKKPVLSVDIPSGIHPDTGQALGIAIKATMTATFGYPKKGQLVYPGAEYCGKISIVEIGIPHIAINAFTPSAFILTPEMIHKYYIKREEDSHKGLNGHLLIAAGSEGKTGAAALTATAALRSGSGLVSMCVPKNLNKIFEVKLTEIMTIPLEDSKSGFFSKRSSDDLITNLEGKNCFAIGPGIGTEESTAKFLKKVITECRLPIVIDADGINCITDNPDILLEMTKPPVLTPHPGEMARLTGTTPEYINKNRIVCANQFAKKYNCHLVLKGARTVIAHPDGEVYINPVGNQLLASGGTGDVLTGIIASLISQGYPVKNAIHTGVYLHGEAADDLLKQYGEKGLTASDIIDSLPKTILKQALNKLNRLNFIETII